MRPEPKFKVGDFVRAIDGWTGRKRPGRVAQTYRVRSHWLYVVRFVKKDLSDYDRRIECVYVRAKALRPIEPLDALIRISKGRR